MNRDLLADALDGLNARDLERLRQLVDRRLQTCSICGADGADAFRVSRGGVSFSMLICAACVHRHRLPEGRVKDGS